MRPQRPTDLLVTNGWYLELPGLISPHFETLEGVQRSSNDVSIVDAGTNTKFNFGAQITDYGEMTLTRTLQNNVDDQTLSEIVFNMINRGLKLPVMAVKLHHQKEVFRLSFTGFRFKSENQPTWDVNAEDKFLISYGATCDGWKNIPV